MESGEGLTSDANVVDVYIYIYIYMNEKEHESHCVHGKVPI